MTYKGAKETSREPLQAKKLKMDSVERENYI